MTDQVQKLINQKQAAKILGISPQTLRRWVKDSKVPHVRVKTVVRFNEDSIKKLVQIAA